MRNRFQAKDDRSWKLRFHSQTAGGSLTGQQAYNNVMRTTWQALAAVMGGTNSLHTCSLDEALALPTSDAATLALRTQQIIAHETGITEVADPLGGSYLIETLTREMENKTSSYFKAIDDCGGMVEAIEQGYPQREIAESAYRDQKRVESGERAVVGVTTFVDDGDAEIPTLYIDESTEQKQLDQLQLLKRERDSDRVARALEQVRAAADGTTNMMEPLLDAVRVYATLGEMCNALRDVWGEYEETPMI